jgi:AcrR family transcriptional regulator
MPSDHEAAPTRWAGMSIPDRRRERRALLVASAFALFGTEGEAAVSVRAVCRESGLNTRYFYESFTDTDELLGAVYDKVAAELDEDVTAAMAAAQGGSAARVRAAIRTVLAFSTTDPRRGRVLFTEARTNPVLASRREAANAALMEALVRRRSQARPAADQRRARVGAALFTGGMAELAHQWLSGNLGDDLDVVVDHAVKLTMKTTLGSTR